MDRTIFRPLAIYITNNRIKCTAFGFFGSLVWFNTLGSDPPKVQEAKLQRRYQARFEQQQVAAEIEKERAERSAKREPDNRLAA